MPGKVRDHRPLAAGIAAVDENAGTARLVARARQEIAAGAPIIPRRVVHRIANGENALRALREWRGMTLRDLSVKTGIGQSDPSYMENGRRRATTAELEKIADALKVPVDLLA